jgi:alpha-N-arabinofuranosidase
LATIKIDSDRQIGPIDRKIYGGFIEHLGRCIYGGIYEENSPLSDEHGYRKDVMEAVRDLQVPLLRWPGGNFVSGYRWTDGIGPVEKRPRHTELAWHWIESNRFGTDEFIEYCRTMDIEPYLCVNMGTGTMDEARAWVEYCNGTADTYWANLRRQNGHEEPYNVKYWGLGNEVYGSWQIGHLDAEDYVKHAREFAKVMKWTDPSIKLVGCGENGWSDWDNTVIPGLAPYIDYYSLHAYTGSADYYSNVLAPTALLDFGLESCQAIIERARYNQNIDHPIHIAFDEWNVWYRKREAETALEEVYNLADALAVASYLNTFIRHSDSVKIANLAQLVNVIAPIFTSKEGLFLQTIYHPLRLFVEQMQEIALDIYVDSETIAFTKEQEDIPFSPKFSTLGPFLALDVSATRDTTGKVIAIAVVNRDHENPHTTTVTFADAAIVQSAIAYEVNAADPNTSNSFEEPTKVTVQEHQAQAGEPSFTYTFPAHSLTLLHLQLA